MSKTTTKDVDLGRLPPLTAKQKAELAVLEARPEGEIDYSNIPELADEQWKDAVRGRFYRPVKQQMGRTF